MTVGTKRDREGKAGEGQVKFRRLVVRALPARYLTCPSFLVRGRKPSISEAGEGYHGGNRQRNEKGGAKPRRASLLPAYDGYFNAGKRSRSPLHPAIVWTRGIIDHTDLHPGSQSDKLNEIHPANLPAWLERS